MLHTSFFQAYHTIHWKSIRTYNTEEKPSSTQSARLRHAILLQMGRAFFEPSEQLKGGTHASRDLPILNSNYKGDHGLPVNRGTHVPDDKNTNLWVVGLPGTITIPKLLSSIRGIGRVRSAVVNEADDTHGTAAAAVSFFLRKDAEKLLRASQNGAFSVEGLAVKIFWNRNKVEEDTLTVTSRILLIVGDADVVNVWFLERFFSGKFVYDVDSIVDHGIVVGFGGPVARIEYRFGSARGQAVFAHMALARELEGKLLVAFGEDPCAN
ncbi:hypothetical protein AAE478_005758 [Parahypoxylon ruwenzoriense]